MFPQTLPDVCVAELNFSFLEVLLNFNLIFAVRSLICPPTKQISLLCFSCLHLRYLSWNTDKYKYKIMKIRVSWVGQPTTTNLTVVLHAVSFKQDTRSWFSRYINPSCENSFFNLLIQQKHTHSFDIPATQKVDFYVISIDSLIQQKHIQSFDIPGKCLWATNVYFICIQQLPFKWKHLTSKVTNLKLGVVKTFDFTDDKRLFFDCFFLSKNSQVCLTTSSICWVKLHHKKNTTRV